MDNIYLTALVVSILYLVCKFLEMRFIIKENKPLKTIIIDTIFVYFCVIISFVLIDQFNLKTKTLTEAPVFIDNPKF
jgi:hypothetical protein|tara:strand:+ start:954 stop:1184 length:231 start_codon:yes stop_codon:yes gene_type:complete